MPSLIIRLGPREIDRHMITATQTVIGRGEGCDVRLQNDAVSRRHAAVELHQGRFRVRDLGSGNGIMVDGNPTPGAPLEDGTQIHIGKFIVMFQQAGGVEIDRLRRVTLENEEVLDVHETTHLDPDYVAKMHSKLKERDLQRRVEQDKQLIAAEERARRASNTNSVLWVIAALLAAALAYVLWRG